MEKVLGRWLKEIEQCRSLQEWNVLRKKIHFNLSADKSIFPLINEKMEAKGSVLAEARKGYFDNDGRLVADYHWDEIGLQWMRGDMDWWAGEDFWSEERAVIRKGSKFGFIDRDENLISACQWDVAWDFEGGRAIVQKDGVKSYIDLDGMLMAAGDSEKIAHNIAHSEENKDAEGGLIENCRWEQIEILRAGRALVRKNGKWGIIDSDGRVISELRWSDMIAEEPASENGAIVCEGGKYGFINPYGQMISECQWDWADSFVEGRARVGKDGKYGFIDTHGQLIGECQWNNICEFSCGRAFVRKEDLWGIIDRDGNMISDYKWKAHGYYEFEYFAVQLEDGFIDLDGNFCMVLN